MYITDINIKDFRNISGLKLRLGRHVNVLTGGNAQGKTSFVEALYFCTNGRSLRGSHDRELVNWEKSEAHIQLFINRNGLNDRIDVHLKTEGIKGIAVNGIAVKRLGDLIQNVFAVIFSPEDLSLVKGGPNERRRFADIQLCRMSNIYYNDLQQYYRVLKQRNLLLKDIQRKKLGRETLFVWDEQLADYGARIISARESFVDIIGKTASEIHYKVSGNSERLALYYRPSVLAEEFLNRLSRGVERDVAYGSTGVGIHKDDILFSVNGKDARVFASQGQQRTACLSAILAEVELIRSEKREDPILLLDDVFSELDDRRRAYLVDFIGGMQTFITCTGMDEAIKKITSPELRLYFVENGNISGM